MLRAILFRIMSTFLRIYKKGKIFRPLAMKAYRTNRGTAPLILNFGTRWRWLVNFTLWPLHPRESAPVPIE